MSDIIDTRIIQLVQCLHYWLSYVNSVSKTPGLLAESSIKVPIIEFIERQNCKTYLEVTHPVFKYKRIDMCLGFDENETEHTRWSKPRYIELKFVRNETNHKIEKQRFYDDIMRLNYVSKENPKAECYFLVCGLTTDFSMYFSKGIIEGTNVLLPSKEETPIVAPEVYNVLFSFDINNRIKHISGDVLGEYWDNFKKKYKKYNDEVIIDEDCRVNTELICLFPTTNETNKSFSVGIWKVTHE